MVSFAMLLKKLRFNKDYRERPESCPLVELPEHGELVDLDAVVDCQYYDDMYEEWSIRTVTVRDVLYGCLEAMPPVVIPASSSKLHEEGRV